VLIIFGPKGYKIITFSEELPEELHNLYSSENIVRMIKSPRVKWTGHVARMGEKWSAYRFQVGKSEGKRPLGNYRYRWEDNIKMDLREIEEVVRTGLF
jgi:hypothetical protein